MEPVDILREEIAKYTCAKYSLPAIVLGRGRNVSVICCCQEFANKLQTEMSKTADKEIGNLKINFIAGNVEFV
ncbi:MAG: hypothetical protein ACHQHN_03395 [Sphingobacteriales bacterium]